VRALTLDSGFLGLLYSLARAKNPSAFGTSLRARGNGRMHLGGRYQIFVSNENGWLLYLKTAVEPRLEMELVDHL